MLLPPRRFYYNLGEWLRDMDYNQTADHDYYYDLGRYAAYFYEGALSVLDDPAEAMELTVEIIARTQMEVAPDVDDDGEG